MRWHWIRDALLGVYAWWAEGVLYGTDTRTLAPAPLGMRPLSMNSSGR